jgi:hypothetical protein
MLAAEIASVPHTQAVASASLTALGLPAHVSVAGGTATVALPHASPDEVAEIVYTLTQYPSIQRVDVAGRAGLTRNDVAAFVPPILVETPAAGATVPKQFQVHGSASVFEATLVVAVRQNGSTVEKKTVTASQGAPGRGSFDAPVSALYAGPATVVAYAPSAENGAPQHQVDIPITVKD